VKPNINERYRSVIHDNIRHIPAQELQLHHHPQGLLGQVGHLLWPPLVPAPNKSRTGHLSLPSKAVTMEAGQGGEGGLDQPGGGGRLILLVGGVPHGKSARPWSEQLSLHKPVELSTRCCGAWWRGASPS